MAYAVSVRRLGGEHCCSNCGLCLPVQLSPIDSSSGHSSTLRINIIGNNLWSAQVSAELFQIVDHNPFSVELCYKSNFSDQCFV